MSTISDRHTFVPFISGKSEAFTGQRLGKVGYKTKSGKKSVCVSIPVLSDESINTIAAAFPLDQRKRIEGFQDDLLRVLYESDPAPESITSDQIDESAILSYLTSLSEGNRLTAEKIAVWFDSSLGWINPVLCTLYPGADEKMLKTRRDAWKTQFVAITGKNIAVDSTLQKLLDMLTSAPEDDSMAMRIADYILDVMKEREKAKDAL